MGSTSASAPSTSTSRQDPDRYLSSTAATTEMRRAAIREGHDASGLWPDDIARSVLVGYSSPVSIGLVVAMRAVSGQRRVRSGCGRSRQLLGSYSDSKSEQASRKCHSFENDHNPIQR